jgi:type IV pilus assembly protein PilE
VSCACPHPPRAVPAARGTDGVTLIELLVVVLVIGILAGISVPGYRTHVLRANRAEGRAALLALATAQEKFYLECHRYAAELDPALDADCEAQRLSFPERSERGHYRLAITGADEITWSATATPAGPPQDADAPCRQLRMDGGGRRSALDARNAENSLECWSR